MFAGFLRFFSLNCRNVRIVQWKECLTANQVAQVGFLGRILDFSFFDDHPPSLLFGRTKNGGQDRIRTCNHRLRRPLATHAQHGLKSKNVKILINTTRKHLYIHGHPETVTPDMDSR